MRDAEKVLRLQEKSLELAKKVFEEVENFCRQNPGVSPAQFVQFLERIFSIYQEYARLEGRGRLIELSAELLKVIEDHRHSLQLGIYEEETSTGSQGGTQ